MNFFSQLFDFNQDSQNSENTNENNNNVISNSLNTNSFGDNSIQSQDLQKRNIYNNMSRNIYQGMDEKGIQEKNKDTSQNQNFSQNIKINNYQNAFQNQFNNNNENINQQIDINNYTIVNKDNLKKQNDIQKEITMKNMQNENINKNQKITYKDKNLYQNDNKMPKNNNIEQNKIVSQNQIIMNKNIEKNQNTYNNIVEPNKNWININDINNNSIKENPNYNQNQIIMKNYMNQNNNDNNQNLNVNNNSNNQNQNFILKNNIENNSKDQNLNINNENLNNNKISIKSLENKNNNLTKEELSKCKENGFILIGKTGVGKTALLNVLYGEDIGKVGHTTKSETKTSNYYCIKESFGEENIYFCIVDTPGLYDTSGKEADDNQKQEIMRLVSNEDIKIKGLLFLSNFQNERFDASEQFSLVEYNAIFPLKEFWKRIILIFTHYYGDPDGDSKEEIQERADKNLAELLDVIMNKTKDVSEKISYNKLNKQYINIYAKIKNASQIKSNQTIKQKLLLEIANYSKLTPMFTKLKILNFEKYELKPGDEYIYDCDYYMYFDSNDKLIHEDFKIKNKYKKSKNMKKEQKINLNVENCEINSQGNLVKKTKKKEGILDIFKKYKGEGLTVLSIIGSICSGIFCLPALPFCLTSAIGSATYLYNEKYREGSNQTNNFMLNQTMIDSINQFLLE